MVSLSSDVYITGYILAEHEVDRVTLSDYSRLDHNGSFREITQPAKLKRTQICKDLGIAPNSCYNLPDQDKLAAGKTSEGCAKIW